MVFDKYAFGISDDNIIMKGSYVLVIWFMEILLTEADPFFPVYLCLLTWYHTDRGYVSLPCGEHAHYGNRQINSDCLVSKFWGLGLMF